jgi:hypothetical protein
MSEVVAETERPEVAGEAAMLAREMAEARRARIWQLRSELGLSAEEAAAKADEPCAFLSVVAIESRPPDQVTWADFDRLANTSQQQAADLWERLKKAGREFLRSGDYAAAVLEGDRSLPWDRALFLAVRAELAEGLQPRNGDERQLVDVMAQAQTSMYTCLRRLAAWKEFDIGPFEEYGAMVDRFHRMYLRTLRALQDLRKGPAAVVVENLGGQVNVANVQANGRGGKPHRGRKARRSRGTNGECTCPAGRRALLG